MFEGRNRDNNIMVRVISSMNRNKGKGAESIGWLVLGLGVRKGFSEDVTFGQEAAKDDGGAVDYTGKHPRYRG